jgi:hypothetical protein
MNSRIIGPGAGELNRQENGTHPRDRAFTSQKAILKK